MTNTQRPSLWSSFFLGVSVSTALLLSDCQVVSLDIHYLMAKLSDAVIVGCVMALASEVYWRTNPR